MSSDAPTQSDELSGKKKAIGKVQAILVFSVIIVPMIAAYLIFKTGVAMPGATVNKGVLLQPALSVEPLNIVDINGDKFSATGKKWRYIIPYSQDCGKLCEDSLYLSRQVHIRLGEKARRVERILVSLDGSAESLTEIAKEHPRLRFANLSSQQLTSWLEGNSVEGDVLKTGNYFLVDQEGFAMMTYLPSHDGAALLGDVKRLLKYSYEE